MTALRLLLVPLAFMFAAHSIATAAIDGFVETFNGDGAFDGFDNPGWIVEEGDGGTFRDGGLWLENSEDNIGSIDWFTRETSGRGSFRTTLEIRDLFLGDVGEFDNPDAGGQLSFAQWLDPRTGKDRGSISVSLTEHTEVTEGQWQLQINRSGERSFTLDVPQSVDALLRMELLFDDTTSTFTVTYDNDTEDNDPSLDFGPFDYLRGFLENQQVRLTIWGSGEGRGNGLIDYFAVVPVSSLAGDFNGNDMLDAEDIDLLSQQVRDETNDPIYDLNDDSLVNEADRTVWVKDLKQAFFGDANFNGEFNSSDLVLVFGVGEYEDELDLNSGWADGDWNGDGDFDSGDLVAAFKDGGYEKGPRAAAQVPEPSSWILLGLGLIGLECYRRNR